MSRSTTSREIAHRATRAQRTAATRTAYLARRVGIGLREARVTHRWPQRVAAARAGIAQSHWSRIERGDELGVALDTLAACAAAVDTQLAAFVEAMPGADLPRDIEHLRRQALVVEAARPAGWRSEPEAFVHDGSQTRWIDVLLQRPQRREAIVVEIWDLILDGGEAIRGLERKVQAIRDGRGCEWHVEGLLVVRGTHRNRRLVRELRPLFAARYPASSRAWLVALRDAAIPMPASGGFLWTTTRGDGLIAARI